ncbi:sodium:solute symporter family protein [Fictibacillus terranigra]|uniref:Sodium:solute symporter family protein n=1 Tax=Fictibacillus terranigra TaxID=3058424 RepID=A0ABT8EBR9_9BACL|nr:sodium:solute symporter family protein [Fictibacillus sp. CENA-BCM004]MDN4075340.1 sodium:solute symporter family protein [Fictibacillus sp. CENA-BCM004]
MANYIHITVVALYLVFMIIMGMYYAKKEVKTSEDFMVAGRRLPSLVLIGTLLATWVGSGTVVGGASFIYQYGPFAALIYFAGAPLGIIVLYFIADKARVRAKYTIPEMLEIRFGKKTRLISAVFILLAYVGITSYQFIGGGYVLNITTGMPVEVGTMITAFIVIFLATTGGLFSVAYTDFLSSFLIVFGFLIGVPLALYLAGGFEGLAQNIPEQKLTWNGGLTTAQILGFFLPTFLLILGDQNMYQRFSAAKDPQSAKKSTIGFFLGDVLIVILSITLATCSIVLFPNIAPDTAILELAAKGFPTVMGSLILASCVAFIITTGNSYLLSSAGNLVYDLIKSFKKDAVPEENLLGFNRIVVIILGILAYAMGQFFPSVLSIQMYSYTMYGAAITPTIIASFLWKRATTAGAISSIITGGLATLFWELVLGKPMGWNSILFSLPLSILALIVVSLFTINKPQPLDQNTISIK